MILGIIFSIFSGLLWGLIFIGPLLIPEYPSILQATGRYIAFGLISLFFSWYDRDNLKKLTLKDWIKAVKLVFIGHLIYYICLVSSIKNIGVPIATAIIGTLPLVITITAYLTHKNMSKFKNKMSYYFILILMLLITLSGLVCINISEIKSGFVLLNIQQHIIGIILGFTSVFCWTWYALSNDNWLKTHINNRPITWANAQGIVILPISCIIYCSICFYLNFIKNEFILPFGPRPYFFILLMILIGFCCSWLGTFFWNEASKRLPTTLIGQLIVFETIAGLIYSFIYRGSWPSILIIVGMFLVTFGVLCAIYLHQIFPKNSNYKL